MQAETPDQGPAVCLVEEPLEAAAAFTEVKLHLLPASCTVGLIGGGIDPEEEQAAFADQPVDLLGDGDGDAPGEVVERQAGDNRIEGLRTDGEASGDISLDDLESWMAFPSEPKGRAGQVEAYHLKSCPAQEVTKVSGPAAKVQDPRDPVTPQAEDQWGKRLSLVLPGMAKSPRGRKVLFPVLLLHPGQGGPHLRHGGVELHRFLPGKNFPSIDSIGQINSYDDYNR